MAEQKHRDETRIVSPRESREHAFRQVNIVHDRERHKVIALTFLVCTLSFSFFLMNPDSADAGNIKGKVHLVGEGNNANAVIYIEKVSGAFPPPDTAAVIDQRNMAFIPEVLPILAGTTVKFMNNDEVLHNVFTPSPCAGAFNLGSFPSGESKSQVFNKAGCAAMILCDIHPDMQAWVVVLQNPYYAVSDKDGDYFIKGVPAGTYTLKAWYGYFKTQSIRITVPESGNVSADFQLKQ